MKKPNLFGGAAIGMLLGIAGSYAALQYSEYFRAFCGVQ